MVSNRQRDVRVQIRSLNKFFTRAIKELRLSEGAAAVCLVTNVQIAKWNAAYRRKNKPTDVLSFPANDEPSPNLNGRRKSRRTRSSSTSSSSYLGDIAIAPAVARRNAHLYGRTFDQEMCILILHGILHLMGYDHETDTGQMERREQRLRRTLGIA